MRLLFVVKSFVLKLSFVYLEINVSFDLKLINYKKKVMLLLMLVSMKEIFLNSYDKVGKMLGGVVLIKEIKRNIKYYLFFF